MEAAGSTEHGGVHGEGLSSDSVLRTSWTKTTLNRKQQDRAGFQVGIVILSRPHGTKAEITLVIQRMEI